MPYTAFWGRSAGQMNVTRTWFAGYINDGTAAGINALRRLKIKRCGELALRLSSRLTFAWGYVAVRAIHLTVNMPLRIRVGAHRVFPCPCKTAHFHLTIKELPASPMRYRREPPATLYHGQHWLMVFITYSLLHLALSTPLIHTHSTNTSPTP